MIIALDAILHDAPRTLFEAIAAAHDFNLRQLSLAEAHRLDGFLQVAEQSQYEACKAWPEKLFLSARLSCQQELCRVMGKAASQGEPQ